MERWIEFTYMDRWSWTEVVTVWYISKDERDKVYNKWLKDDYKKRKIWKVPDEYVNLRKIRRPFKF